MGKVKELGPALLPTEQRPQSLELQCVFGIPDISAWYTLWATIG